jgi:uncharacterized protein (DUF924 family)
MAAKRRSKQSRSKSGAGRTSAKLAKYIGSPIVPSAPNMHAGRGVVDGLNEHWFGRTVDSILEYWFGREPDDPDEIAARQSLWFARPADRPRIDAEIRARYLTEYERASRGELDAWLEVPRGRLAVIILLDQFPRNLFRDSARSFATDEHALDIMNEGLELGQDKELRLIERIFFYMPLVHSESISDQKRGVRLRARLVAEAPARVEPSIAQFAEFQMIHYNVIKQFGRFPHRNQLLYRGSTPEERHFLATQQQVGSGTHSAAHK